MDTLVFVLLTISIALWLSYPSPEPFTDKGSTKTTEPIKPKEPTEAKDPPQEAQPYLQRSFVPIPESTENPRMNCPHNYEIANRELQVQFQDISLGAFGYSKNPYIDLTRFVNFKTIKEPLPVNPDFF